MAVFSTKGLKIKIETDPTGGGSTLSATAITAAKPAVVSVLDVSGLVAGSLVTVAGSGMESLDGKTFVIANLDGTGNTFELAGSDASGEGADATEGTLAVIDLAGEMTLLCLGEIGINSEQPSSIPIGTFCDPSQTVPGAVVSAGTYDLRGYLDVQDAGYWLLHDAKADGKERHLVIEFPQNQGHLVARGTVTTMGFSEIPIDGAAAWQSQFVLASDAIHRY